MTDAQILAAYRLLVPPWLYFALVKQYKAVHGKSINSVVKRMKLT